MPPPTPRPWTPADDTYLCAHYASTPLGAIARALARSYGSLQQRSYALIAAGRLDPSTRHYHAPWTAAADEYLREFWGVYADAAVARHLGRTPEGCKVRATRLGLARKRHLLTARAVARIFAVDDHAVTRWIALGWLAGTKSPIRCGTHHCWRIPGPALEAFVAAHPTAYDRGRIDPNRAPYWRQLADRAAAASAPPPPMRPARAAAHWTPPDDRYLETHWGLEPDATVAAHLGRTVPACVHRAYNLAITRHDAHQGWLRADGAARALGVPVSRVLRWLALRLLPATRSPLGAARPFWQISPQTLAAFARAHPELVHPERYYTASQVARACGVPLAVVVGWIATGALPAQRSRTGKGTGPGARWVITPADLATFRAAHPAYAPDADAVAA